MRRDILGALFRLGRNSTLRNRDFLMSTRSLVVAHGLNIAAWVCLAATLPAFAWFGKPALWGAVVAMLLFALSLRACNRAAKANAAGNECPPGAANSAGL